MTTINTEVLEQALVALEELADEAAGNGNSEEWIVPRVSKIRAALAAQQEPTISNAKVAVLHPTGKVDLVVPCPLPWFSEPIDLYAASPAPVVPPGQQLVPIDATTDMLAAAERILDKKNWDYIDGAVWKAMLSAAPKQE